MRSDPISNEAHAEEQQKWVLRCSFENILDQGFERVRIKGNPPVELCWTLVIPNNRDFKKWKFIFFSSKTCIVEKF